MASKRRYSFIYDFDSDTEDDTLLQSNDAPPSMKLQKLANVSQTNILKESSLIPSSNNNLKNDNLQHDKVDKIKSCNNEPILTGLISPPVTPEKKDRIIGIDPSNTNYGLTTPIKPSPRRLNFNESPYSKAKLLFMRGCNNSTSVSIDNDSVLPTREKEAKLLSSYIKTSLLNNKSTSIYISGPPGTGKTAQITSTIDSLLGDNFTNNEPKTHEISIDGNLRQFRICKINCMTIRTPNDIFNSIYTAIYGTVPSSAPKKTAQQLKDSLLASKSVMTIIILDEMDNLINKNQQILFELFLWASPNFTAEINNPKIVLIGIANALDLTDRFLPRLRANRIQSKVIQFLPYSSDQINSIITTKLLSLLPPAATANNPTIPPIVHPSAIQLCSKKSSSNTGDLRKAFDIIHRSIELTESMTLEKLSYEEFNKLTLQTAPKVMISQVSKICNLSFNSNFNSILSKLNLQNKTVLCSLIKYEENVKNNNLKNNRLTINSFYEFYSTKLNIDKLIGLLKKEEFLEILTTLESSSLITISLTSDVSSGLKRKTVSGGINMANSNFGLCIINSKIPKLEVLKIVDDIGILKNILNSNPQMF